MRIFAHSIAGMHRQNGRGIPDFALQLCRVDGLRGHALALQWGTGFTALQRYPRRLKHGQGVSHQQNLRCLGPVDGAFAAHESRRFHLARRHEGVAILHPPFGQQEQI